ncbi:PRC-barrel domain-containing protein [Pararoseomonas sp. SCSIO 73927]|uniref:PRC-barrel domain-containing protein n=1 Tax=Pararoseomonas sp. SCSIO 73927 TaxID=3114537 RepID=UPI0030D1BD93
MTTRSYKTGLLGMTAAAALLALPALAQTQAQPAPRDGTAGNPPSTATQRAADSVTGNRTPPDGTPGNPPGTALGRAVDRAGESAASANQRAGDPANTQNRPDGTPGNPPGTALGRAVDRAGESAASANQRAGDPANTQNRPDGTPGNPPGTALGRAADRALGTNMSGAYPQNSDGTPNNPPGTAAGRAVDGATAQGNSTSATPRAQNGQPGAVNTMPDGSQARAGTTSAPLQNQAAGNAPNNPSGPSGAPAGTAGRPAAGAAAGVAAGTAANPAATAPMAQTDRVSRIIGSNVYNERNEAIGSVDDVILATGNSSPLAVISVGGFLGIGAKLVAVPMTDLRWSAADNRWTIAGATKESLTSLPAYSYDSARRG